MTVKGVDTIDRNLTGATLAADGYGFVCRYVANAPGGIEKQWSAAEVAEKSAAGVRIVCNFEWATVPANTVAEGKAHATAFLAALAAVGGPDWAPCYWSADSNLKAGALDAYAQGWAETIGPARCGVYGDGALYRDLKAKGLVTLAWQSMSSSFDGNNTTAGADIIQTGSGHVAGHSCDFNTAVSAYYGGWLLGEDSPMALTSSDEPTIAHGTWGLTAPKGSSPADLITNPAARPDSPLHTPAGDNITTSAGFALGDMWNNTYNIIAAVAGVTKSEAAIQATLNTIAAAVTSGTPIDTAALASQITTLGNTESAAVAALNAEIVSLRAALAKAQQAAAAAIATA